MSFGSSWKEILSGTSLRPGGATNADRPADSYGGADAPRKPGDPVGGAAFLAAHRWVALFFGARWHPLCRDAYTPVLIKVHRHLKEQRGDEVEFVYVSLDESEAEFEASVADHPWPAVPWKVGARDRLISTFWVSSAANKLPKLIVLDTTEGAGAGDVVNRDAIPELYMKMNKESDEELARQFPWKVSGASVACTTCTAMMMCSIQ